KPKIIDYLTQLADAVEYMHKEKYLHRDLCPRNVMVTNEGKIKLIDFGLTIPYTPRFCEPGNRTGTPDYLAPEIIRRQTTDHRVDLFALGVTAYEIFTGGPPREKARRSMEALTKHINSPARGPREDRPDPPTPRRRNGPTTAVPAATRAGGTPPSPQPARPA